MQEDDKPHVIKELYYQTTHESKTSHVEHKKSTSEGYNDSTFLVVLTFACNALIACAKQLNIMDEECGDGNYGSSLAQSANAIKMAIEEKKVLATKLSIAFTKISRIVEREVGGLKSGIYSLFFDAAAKSFLMFQNDEQITANTWLTALTFANKTISEVSGASIGDDRTMLNALIPAEHKLRDAINAGLNSVNAFEEAVKAAESSAMQTVQMTGSHYSNSMNHKTFKYPDPGAHAVGIWMRAAYEGFKLKLNC